MSLIEFSDRGLYCRQGNFYIDPWKPVDLALITHAHSDHARYGSAKYLAHEDTIPLLRLRLGEGNYQGLGWDKAIDISGVRVSLHPAGHMIGSSQIRVEYKGEIWVISGDYKVENDGISSAFEPVSCTHFVTESTFGLPIYNWRPQEEVYAQIREWIQRNQLNRHASVLLAYSLGKAQRVLKALEAMDIEIFAHGAIYNSQEVLTANSWKFPKVKRIQPEDSSARYQQAVIIAPPGADGSPWMRRFGNYRVGVCSGWMQVRGNRRRRNADAGFVLSDHADWSGLLSAVKATGAEKVYVTHGFQAAFSRYLNEEGIWSAEVKTAYGTEEEESPPVEDASPAVNSNKNPDE